MGNPGRGYIIRGSGREKNMNAGYEKVKHILIQKTIERAQLRKEQYERNPKLCKECSKPLSRKQVRNKTNFCTRSCSARFNNKNSNIICSLCGGNKHKKSKTSCYTCSRKKQNKERSDKIELWLQGLYTFPLRKGGSISSTIRKYLLNKYNNACVECGWNKLHPITKNALVQIDHVDGNWKNNSPDNLKVLCPNCHSLSPFHGALNKGRGRSDRYK